MKNTDSRQNVRIWSIYYCPSEHKEGICPLNSLMTAVSKRVYMLSMVLKISDLINHHGHDFEQKTMQPSKIQYQLLKCLKILVICYKSYFGLVKSC